MEPLERLPPTIHNFLKSEFVKDCGGFLNGIFPAELYIKPKGTSQVDGKWQDCDLLPTLLDQIKEPSKTSFLIISDSGFGKTSLALSICKKLWESVDIFSESKNLIIPIYIHLPSIPNFEDRKNRLFQQYLKNRFGNEELAEILLDQQLLLLLDGYDEIHGDSETNISETNGWGSNVKVVYFSRPDGLPKDRPNILKSGTGYFEFYIKRFETSEISEYVHHFVEILSKECKSGSVLVDIQNQVRGTKWEKNPEKYLTWIMRFPDLNELARNPLLLSLITTALPGMVAKFKATNDDKVLLASSTKAGVFDQFMDQWGDFQADRIQKKPYPNPLKLLDKNELKGYIAAYSQNLAAKVLRDGFLDSDYFYENTSLADDLAEPYFDLELLRKYNDDPRHRDIFPKSEQKIEDKKLKQIALEILRSGCMLQFHGKSCRFQHRAVLEYCASQDIFRDFQCAFEFYVSEVEIKPLKRDVKLNLAFLRDRSVISLLGDRVKTESKFREHLFRVVELSKHSSSFNKMASNAVTILNCGRVSFSNMNFRDVQLPCADFQQALCSNTDFRGANLSRANFQNAWFPNCNFQGAYLNEVETGEGVPFKTSDGNGVSDILNWVDSKGREFWITVSPSSRKIEKYDVKTGKKHKVPFADFGKPVSDSLKIRICKDKNGRMFMITWEQTTGTTSFTIYAIPSFKRYSTVSFDPGYFINSVVSISTDSCGDYLLVNLFKSILVFNISGLKSSKSGALEPKIIHDWKPSKFTKQVIEAPRESSEFINVEGFSVATISGSGLKAAFSTAWNVYICPVGTDENSHLLLDKSGASEIQFTPDEEWLIIVNVRNLKIINLSKQTVTVTEHGGTVGVLAISPDSAILAVTSSIFAKSVKLFAIKNGQLLQQLTSYYAEVHTGLAFSSNSQYLAASSDSDPNIRVWKLSLSNSAELPIEANQNAQVTMLAKSCDWLVWVDNENHVAYTSYDGTMRFWNLTSSSAGRVVSLSGFGKWILAVGFIDELLLVIGSGNTDNVALYKTSGDLVRRFTMVDPNKAWNNGWSVNVICSSNSKKYFATARTYLHMFEIDMKSDSLFKEIVFAGMEIESKVSSTHPLYYDDVSRYYIDIKFNCSGSLLVTLRKSNAIELFDTSRKILLKKIKNYGGFQSPVSIIFLKNDKRLLIGHAGFVLIALDTKSETFERVNGLAGSTVFKEIQSRNIMVTGNRNAEVELWEISNWAPILKIPMWYPIRSFETVQTNDSWTFTLFVGGVNRNFSVIKLTECETTGDWTWSLIWSNGFDVKFTAFEANIEQAVGLTETDCSTLYFFGAKGEASKNSYYVHWADFILPIPGTGNPESCFALTAPEIPLSISTDNWVVSIAVQKVVSSIFSKLPIKHVELVLEGMRDNRRFALISDLTHSRRGAIFNVRPVGDLQRFRRYSEKYKAVQKRISRSQGLVLLRSIQDDQHSKECSKGYHFLKKNCAVWAREKLEILGFEFFKPWYEAVFVLPSAVIKK